MSVLSRNGASLARKFKVKAMGPIIGALLAVAGGLLLLQTHLGEKLVFASYDIPFSIRPYIFPKDVVLVYIDEASYDALGQPQNTYMDRAVYARLIDRMTKEKARAIAFDVVFSDANHNAADDALIAATKKNGRVIYAVDFVAPPQNVQGVTINNEYTPPFPALDAVAASEGTDEINAEDDLMNRQHIPFTTNDTYHGISWATARFLKAPITTEKHRKDWAKSRWFDYYGPDKVIPYVSLFQAVQPCAEAPEGFFSNKVVFVGQKVFTTSFADRKDEYPAPFPNLDEKDKFMPGVEIQATEFLNLTRGDWLNRLDPKQEEILFIAIGLLLGVGLAVQKPFQATVCAVGAAFLVGLLEYAAFTHFHYWFPWTIVVFVQVPLALIWSVAYNSVQLYVEKKLVEQSLSLYLSPKLVKQVAKDASMLKPGAKKQLLTILFSDIAGFTTISEGMDSDHLALAMNEYFQSAVQNCVFATDGTVVKYIGDAIFAFWNAPEAQDDHSRRACEAALRFRDQPKQFMNNKELVTRIGLHTGVANVGNFGSMTRIDYTALGENINLASRMEGLNKYLGTRVLVTDETQKSAGDQIITRYIGQFRLKGFEKAVGVYELSGRIAEAAATKELRERFAQAVELFVKKNLDGAAAAFRRVLEIVPHDGPSEFYLEQIEELRETELPADWKGEIILKEK